MSRSSSPAARTSRDWDQLAAKHAEFRRLLAVANMAALKWSKSGKESDRVVYSDAHRAVHVWLDKLDTCSVQREADDAHAASVRVILGQP